MKLYGTPVYVKHELIHNEYVLKELCKKGVVFIEDINDIPNGSVLIFSAHGVSKKVKEQAKNKNLIVFDATCPLVSKVHMEVARAFRKKMEVILIGHAGHPEVEGIIGQYVDFNLYSTKKIYLIESQRDAWLVPITQPDYLYYVTQTTLSVDDTADIIQILYKRFPKIQGPKKSDICYATFNRQNVLKKIILSVELIFVIGSKNSSNSNRLLELAQKNGKPAYLINTVNDIQIKWLQGISSIGITSGASTPEVLVKKILKNLCMMIPDHVSVKEIYGKKETVFFDIPKTLISSISNNI